MRTTIEEIVGGVRLTCWDPEHYNRNDDTFGARVTVEYSAPNHGGYVRFMGEGRQVCEGLYTTGRTLEWNGKGKLSDLIRHEWRRRKRLERKVRS